MPSFVKVRQKASLESLQIVFHRSIISVKFVASIHSE